VTGGIARFVIGRSWRRSTPASAPQDGGFAAHARRDPAQARRFAS